MIIFEKLGKVVVKIILVSLFIGLSFLTYCYFSLYVLKSDYVNIFGYTFFEVGSGSMSPTILSNDVIVVKLNENYQTNDIVTFRYGDSIVTHRIVKINGDKIITKGDANNIRDLSVNKDSMIGKVVFVWKKAGIWRKVFINSRVIVLVIITFVLFIVTFSYDSRLYKKFRMRRLSKKKIKDIKKDIRTRNKKERILKKRQNNKQNSRSRGK